MEEATMTATAKEEADRKLPTAKVVKRSPEDKAPALPSESRRKWVHDRLKGSPFASDNLD